MCFGGVELKRIDRPDVIIIITFMASTASAGGRALLRRLGQRLVDSGSSIMAGKASRRGRNGVAVLSRQLQVRLNTGKWQPAMMDVLD